jgi:hypothetical protein
MLFIGRVGFSVDAVRRLRLALDFLRNPGLSRLSPGSLTVLKSYFNLKIAQEWGSLLWSRIQKSEGHRVGNEGPQIFDGQKFQSFPNDITEHSG